MPNGRPGDNELTDILVHGMDVYGPRCDGLVREIANLGGEERLVTEVTLPARWSPERDRSRLEAELVRLRDALSAEHRRDREA
jgi:hypothetical protein